NCRAQLAVALIAKRRHDAESVGGTAHKDRHESLALPAFSRCGTHEPARRDTYSRRYNRRMMQKNTSRQHFVLPPLEVGRTENQRCNEGRFEVLSLKALVDGCCGLGRCIAPQQFTLDRYRVLSCQACWVHLYTLNRARNERDREIHS